MRCELDGSNVETLIQSGQGDDDRRDETRWCVGITVDHAGGYLYWTQKGPSDAGLGRILRAGIDVPAGESAANRSDIEVVFKDLPEPIDLEIDHATRMLYWTDRGDPPDGNTVNRAPLDDIGHAEPEIVATHLMEGIGIALDPANNRMFVTDLGGNIYVPLLTEPATGPSAPCKATSPVSPTPSYPTGAQREHVRIQRAPAGIASSSSVRVCAG